MSDIILVADKNGNPVGGVRANSRRAVLRANAQSMVAERLSYGLQGTQFGGARDYYEILGYPREPDKEDFAARFDRDPVAGRVVEFPAEETWRETPTIKDGKDKDAKENTDFTNAWSDFAETMRIYSYCQSVDTLAGIGRFGLLHIGVAGSGDLATEVKRVADVNDIMYLQPYGEEDVSIYEWQTDPSNRRYGLPHKYKISVAHMEGAASNQFGSKEITVHWSRCIHVAEGLLRNGVYGRPRLQRVINLLDDILKVVGGSAEATWLLMRKGFVLDIDPEMDDMSPEAITDLEEQLDDYNHGISRFVKTRGMKVNDLGSEVVDPSGLFDTIITLVSVATHIPKRILLGSERGELASSQDAANWAGYIGSRQLNYAEPIILRPMIDRMVRWGAIPPPSAGRYTCVWDALFKLNDTEKVNNMKTAAQALQAAGAALGGPVATPEEFRGEYTPFPGKLPPELEEARAMAQQPIVPPGDDVLDQVGKIDAVKAMVANHGYNEAQGRAMIVAAARIISRQGR